MQGIKKSFFTTFTMMGILLPIPSHAASFLEEVTVTAKKREESLQDVSVAVTAFSGDTMREVGLTNSNNMSQLVPNVEIITPFGNQLAQIHIRGSGSVDYQANSQTTIGFYVDEVYLPNTFQHSTQLFDLERTEILRGPQGTLYGRNSTAGAINVITAKPEQEFSGYGRVGFGNYDAVRMDGAVTGGITENLAGRVAFTYEDDDGWMTGRTNLPGTVGGDDFNATKFYAWRGALAWTPTENVSVLFNVHGSQDDSRGFSYQHVGAVDPNTGAFDCNATRRSDCVDAGNFFIGGPIYADPDGVEENGDPTSGDFNLEGPADYSTVGGYIRVDLELENFTLTSISAFDNFERFHTEDADASPATLSHNWYQHEVDGWSQELRLTSSTEGAWDWIAGVYYGTDEIDSHNIYNFFEFVTDQVFDQEQESIGVYFNLGYQINDRFKIYGGLRYSRDEIELNHTSTLFDPDPALGGFGTGLSVFDPGTRGTPDFDDVNWKVGIDYTPNENWLIYAHVGTGYKSGGVNVGFGDPGEFNIYEQEDILAVEGGFKSTLFDEKVRFNLSAFYYDYRDLQAFDINVGSFSNPINVIGNADESDYMGAEAELTLAPTEGLYFNLGLSYLETEYKKFFRPTSGQDLAGNENVLSPKWKFTGIARYEWDTPQLFEGRMAMTLNWSWTDQAWHTVENLSSLRAKKHWLVGARLAFWTLDDKLELALWSRNLTDEEYRVQSFDTADNGFITSVPNKPRTYGIEIGYNF